MTTLKDALRRAKQSIDNEIAQMILDFPTMSYEDIAKQFGVSQPYVSTVAKSRKIQRPTGTASPAWKKR